MEAEDQATRHAVAVRLKPVDHSDQPITANFSTVAVAQGIAYLDFGFIELALLAKVMVEGQNGKAVPEHVDGKLVVRISLGLVVLARLQGQMQQVFMNLRQPPVNGAKTGPS